jgi:hypothetical protein
MLLEISNTVTMLPPPPTESKDIVFYIDAINVDILHQLLQQLDIL